MNKRILRLSQVKFITGLSRSTIYERISANTFPQSIQLGGRSVGWLEHEVNEWIEQRIAESRN